MRFEIVAEGHEGVFSVPEETLAVVEANSDPEALEKYAQAEPRLKYCEPWNRWLIGSRKITTRKLQA
jgi:hypothetical protein